MRRNFRAIMKNRCWKKNGNDKANWSSWNSSNILIDRRKSTRLFSNRTSKLSVRKSPKWRRKKGEIVKWLRESSQRKGNSGSMRSSWRKRKGKRREESWQGLKAKMLSWHFMKRSLIGLLRLKDSRKKRNSRKNGKKGRRQESTCFTKFMTTEREKSGKTKRLKRRISERKNKIEFKWKGESGSTRPRKSSAVKLNTRGLSSNRRIYYSKLHKNRREEGLFC